jgi:formate hydrogenlyase subunit 3/multisubunit Na+/H+ antiporter MnhD subunit
VTFLLAAVLVYVAGGVLAAALSRWPRAASITGCASVWIGSALGIPFAARAIQGEVGPPLALAWHVPNGAFVVGCDRLSAFFLIPIFGLGAAAAAYGYDYLLAYRAHKSLGVPWAAYNFLLAAMALVVTARHAVLFLLAWEIMALTSYVLITFEHEKPDVLRAGWVYLIGAHVGVASLIAMFVILGDAQGTLLFGAGGLSAHPVLPAHPVVDGRVRVAVLLLALVGFGIKAGLVPFHVWLPEAHAAAPSHVSALMSGIIIKLGLYGIVRMTLLVGPPPLWWGRLLMVIGLGSALFGIALAIYQRDLKRVFAYSSIENVGLVVLGLGLGFWGEATGHPVIGALGLLGALLHAWNHAMMKGLLFFGAGAVLHATGTRDLERLGGLLRRMPVAGALTLVGAISIAALPPLNGFASEWLLYRSLMDGASLTGSSGSIGFMVAVGSLSMVGAMTALAFVRACSTALLGEPRSEAAAHAHEASPTMLAAMGLLAAGCVLVGVRPAAVARVLAGVAVEVMPGARAEVASACATLVPVGVASLALWGAGALVAVVLLRSVRGRARAPRAEGPTWGCGYAAPTPRMQYTARSFAQLFADGLPRWLRPRTEASLPDGLFPRAGAYVSSTRDPLTRSVYEPSLARTADWFSRLRWVQQGAVQLYVFYVLVALVAALAWAAAQGGGAP